MAESKWIAGAPSERGTYWIFWRSNYGWKVALVNISPALLNPGGKLLLKMTHGGAYDYALNVDRITHHMTVEYPEPPRGLSETYEWPHAEAKANEDV